MAIVLSQRDRDILAALIREVEGGRVNIPIRPPTGWSQVEGHQAPEVYLAKPQSANGIPALSLDDPDVPGSDICDFYRVNRDGEIEQIPNLERTVYNLTNDPIRQDWFLVTRTKSGKWVATVIREFDRCDATLDGSISGSIDVTVDAVVATRGVSPLSDPTDAAETITDVKNDRFQFTGDDGANCNIEYDNRTGEWQLVQVECPA